MNKKTIEMKKLMSYTEKLLNIENLDIVMNKLGFYKIQENYDETYTVDYSHRDEDILDFRCSNNGHYIHFCYYNGKLVSYFVSFGKGNPKNVVVLMISGDGIYKLGCLPNDVNWYPNEYIHEKDNFVKSLADNIKKLKETKIYKNYILDLKTGEKYDISKIGKIEMYCENCATTHIIDLSYKANCCPVCKMPMKIYIKNN